MTFNDVRSHSTLDAASGASRRRLWSALAVGILGPAATLALLPAPATQIALLAGSRWDGAVGAITILVATAVATAVLAWTALIALAAAAAHLPGALGGVARRVLVRVTPAVVRNIVVATAGLSLATGLAACGGQPAAATAAPVAAASAGQWHAPVAATWGSTGAPTADQTSILTGPGASVGAHPPATTTSIALNLDWPVDRPATASSAHTTSADTSPTPAPPADEPSDGHVVVLRGDSLWSIAAAHLPDDATCADIDRTWRAWYQANRDVIGPDAGLILPGQVLRAPDSGPAAATAQRQAPTVTSQRGEH